MCPRCGQLTFRRCFWPCRFAGGTIPRRFPQPFAVHADRNCARADARRSGRDEVVENRQDRECNDQSIEASVRSAFGLDLCLVTSSSYFSRESFFTWNDFLHRRHWFISAPNCDVLTSLSAVTSVPIGLPPSWACKTRHVNNSR